MTLPRLAIKCSSCGSLPYAALAMTAGDFPLSDYFGRGALAMDGLGVIL